MNCASAMIWKIMTKTLLPLSSVQRKRKLYMLWVHRVVAFNGATAIKRGKSLCTLQSLPQSWHEQSTVPLLVPLPCPPCTPASSVSLYTGRISPCAFRLGSFNAVKNPALPFTYFPLGKIPLSLTYTGCCPTAADNQSNRSFDAD